jgi:hypothetical protein
MISLETQMDLLEGTTEPQDEAQQRWLLFMGGIRGPKEGWPMQWIECIHCHSEWQARGFPSPTGKWVFPFVCEACRAKANRKPFKMKALPEAKSGKVRFPVAEEPF